MEALCLRGWTSLAGSSRGVFCVPANFLQWPKACLGCYGVQEFAWNRKVQRSRYLKMEVMFQKLKENAGHSGHGHRPYALSHLKGRLWYFGENPVEKPQLADTRKKWQMLDLQLGSCSDCARSARRYFHVGVVAPTQSHEKKLGRCSPIDKLMAAAAQIKLTETTQALKDTKDKMKEKVEDIITRENIVTIPNLLCVTRIVLSPVLGYLVLIKSFDFALGVFVFAGITDLLDGFIARNFKNQQSMFGSFLDPMADKFLITILVLSLTFIDLLPGTLTALIIGRDVCLLGAGFYIRYLSLPPPRTFWRYFDATLATARLSPTFLSKVNTFIQLTLVACTLASPIFHFESHPALHTLWYLTATSTVISAISYVFSKNTYRLLKQFKMTKQ